MNQIKITSAKVQLWTGLLTVLSALCAVFFFWLNWLNSTYASRSDTNKLNIEIVQLKRDLTLQLIELRITENENSLYEFEKMLRDIDTKLSARDSRQYQQLLATKKTLITEKRKVMMLLH